MKTIIKVIGLNDYGYNQFGIAVTDESHTPGLVDGGNNANGQCATNTFESSDEIKPLKLFTNKGMHIKKICTNVNALNVFWITESGQVYGNVANDKYQLGIAADNDDKCRPILVDGLKGAIDIQSNYL